MAPAAIPLWSCSFLPSLPSVDSSVSQRCWFCPEPQCIPPLVLRMWLVSEKACLGDELALFCQLETYPERWVTAFAFGFLKHGQGDPVP